MPSSRRAAAASVVAVVLGSLCGLAGLTTFAASCSSFGGTEGPAVDAGEDGAAPVVPGGPEGGLDADAAVDGGDRA